MFKKLNGKPLLVIKTVDYVQQFLGHKKHQNTELYLHMESIALGESGNDEYTVKVAEKADEVKGYLKSALNTSPRRIA